MTAIFRRMDIHVVREASVKNARTPDGPWLPKSFINAMLLIETSDELFEQLVEDRYLDYFNLSILESIIAHTKSELAQKVFDAYKKYMMPLTFNALITMNSEVPRIEDPGPEYAKVKEVLAMNLSKMTVGSLRKHKDFLEKNVFDINSGSTRLAGFDHRKNEVIWIIPNECSYHVYKYANSNMHNFDTIVSLEVENYPVIKKSLEFSVDPPLCES